MGLTPSLQQLTTLQDKCDGCDRTKQDHIR